MTFKDRYTRPVAGSAALVLIDVQRDFLRPDDAPMRSTVRARRFRQWPSWRKPSATGGSLSCMSSGYTCRMGRTSTWFAGNR